MSGQAVKHKAALKVDAAICGAFLVIFAQLLSIYFFVTTNSYFVADDLRAFVELRSADFFTYIAMPIDVHRVPLHRAINFLIGSYFPLNFHLAAAFLVACHGLSLLLIYRILQEISPGKTNLILMIFYAVNPYILSAMNWWSAGLHRFPYILFAIASCYGFLFYHIKQRFFYAVIALIGALLATGFYVKGILVPCYWLAMLFCSAAQRRAHGYSRELTLIGVGLLASIFFVVWYFKVTPFNPAISENRIEVLLGCLRLFWSVIAQMFVPIKFDDSLSTYINIAWAVVICAVLVRSRSAWRPVLSGFALVTLNILVIAMSARAAVLGAFIALIMHYYAELIFLLVLFLGYAISCMRRELVWRQISLKASHSRVLLVVILSIYIAMAWRAVYLNIQPGTNSASWQSARYARNFFADMRNQDQGQLNFLDRAMPRHFGYGGLIPRVLPLSSYLALAGKIPGFNDLKKPLKWVDEDGRIRSVKIAEIIPFFLSEDSQPYLNRDGHCVGAYLSSNSIQYVASENVAGERGMISIRYSASAEVDIEMSIKSHDDNYFPVHVHLPANASKQIADLSLAGAYTSFSVDAITLTGASSPICIESIALEKY